MQYPLQDMMDRAGVRPEDIKPGMIFINCPLPARTTYDTTLGLS